MHVESMIINNYNQLCERAIAQKHAEQATNRGRTGNSSGSSSSAAVITPVPRKIPELSSIQFASRRLIDALALHTQLPAGSACLWHHVAMHGIPLTPAPTTKDQPSFWCNFRQKWFLRKVKREKLDEYGGNANVENYGKATPWREMLKYCADHGLLKRKVVNEEDSVEDDQADVMQLACTKEGEDFIINVDAVATALDQYKRLMPEPAE